MSIGMKNGEFSAACVNEKKIARCENEIVKNENESEDGVVAEASFDGAGGRRPQGKRKKKTSKKKRKKREKERKREKRKKGTMNNVKLLHIKCCFFQFFNSQVALKNKKSFGPPRKS